MSSSGDTAERDVSDRLVLDRSSRMSFPKRRPQTPGGPKHREAPNTGRPQTPGGPKHREAPNTGKPHTPRGPKHRETPNTGRPQTSKAATHRERKTLATCNAS